MVFTVFVIAFEIVFFILFKDQVGCDDDDNDDDDNDGGDNDNIK